VVRDLNLAWKVERSARFRRLWPDGGGVNPAVANDEVEVLEVAVPVLHDVLMGPSRRNSFLSRVRLNARQFVCKGEEALVHFPLQKKSFLNWMRGISGSRCTTPTSLRRRSSTQLPQCFELLFWSLIDERSFSGAHSFVVPESFR
jgi:hypothetical protein